MAEMKPINVSPIMRVFFATLPKLNTALANEKVSVNEAIDLAASIAKASAREMGIADNPVLVTEEYRPDGEKK